MIRSSVSPRELKEIIREFCKVENPPTLFIWGQPGIGKSEIVRQVSEEMGLDLRIMVMSLMDPAEVKGFIMPDRKKKEAVIFPLNFLPREPGILFLDEVNCAPPAVLNTTMRMIQEREIGNIKIPERILVICAGNRMTDKVFVSKLPSAFINKCIHINVEPSLDDFREWGILSGISPIILGYLESYPNDLVGEPRNDSPFPSPRAWEKVNKILQLSLPIYLKQALISGAIGDEIGMKFIEFMKNSSDLPEIIHSILEEGKNIYPQVDEPAKSYMVISSLTQRACKDHQLIRRIFEYLNEAPEYFSPFAVAAIKNIIKIVGEQAIYIHARDLIEPFVRKFSDVFKGF